MNRDEKQAIRNHMTTHRKEILDHTWNRCVNCGTDKDIELHHIVPLANGGNHIFTNIAPLCRDCHMKAHGKVWKTENHAKGGRKGFEMPDNYTNIINQYLVGMIDRDELIAGLGFSSTVKLDSIKPYQDYLKEHHIVKVVSNVKRNKNKQRYQENRALTVVYFDDQTKRTCYRDFDGKIKVCDG